MRPWLLFSLIFCHRVIGSTFCFELENRDGLCENVEAEMIGFEDAVGLYDGFEGINFWPIKEGDTVYLAGKRTIRDGAVALSIDTNNTTWIGIADCKIKDIVAHPITENCIQQYSPLKIGGDNVLLKNISIIRQIDSRPDSSSCTNFTTLYPSGVRGDSVTLDNIQVSFSGPAWTPWSCKEPCYYKPDDCIKLTGDQNRGGNNFTLKNSIIEKCGESGLDVVGEDNGSILNNSFSKIFENGISIKGGSINWNITNNLFSYIKYHPVALGGTSDGRYQESCDFHVKNVDFSGNIIYGRNVPEWSKYKNLGLRIAGVDSLFSYENEFIDSSIDETIGIVIDGCDSERHVIHNGYLEID